MKDNKKLEVESFKSMIEESINNYNLLKGMVPNILNLTDLFDNCILTQRKIFFAGNGGSAADSQHFSSELVGRYKKERPAINAQSLTVDTSILTAIANDYNYNRVFSRQLEAYGNKGDLFVGLSTSGNSENLLNAIETSNNLGIKTVGLLGRDGGKMKSLVDYALIVPSNNTPRIQEVHTFILHCVCEILEERGSIESKLYS